MPTSEELNLDVSAEEARALHRVVRAMHDGHCPSCSYLGPAAEFEQHYARGPNRRALIDHVCPQCSFGITYKEAEAALKAFQPHLLKSVSVFEKWRADRR